MDNGAPRTQGIVQTIPSHIFAIFNDNWTVKTMHPLVRELYKRILIAGRYHPDGLSYIRNKAKLEFFKHKDIPIHEEAKDGSKEISMALKRCIKDGRYWAKEIVAIGQFHKYRAMKKRYSDD